MATHTPPVFTPQLYIPNGVKDISFYTRALDAQELRRWPNEDDSIHVAELSLAGAIFHLHEASGGQGLEAPATYKGTTVMLGLFVADVHNVVNQAIAAGATLLSPVTDYDYGYRQGVIKDPFGHVWMIQQKIG